MLPYWTCEKACLEAILTLTMGRVTLLSQWLPAKASTQVHGISSIGVGRGCGVHAVPMRDLTLAYSQLEA